MQFVESINIPRVEEVTMNKVQLTNMLQLKIIESHYGLSSVTQSEEFNIAFMEFVKNKGPQKLRKLLDDNDKLIQSHLEQDRPWTHGELVYLSMKIFREGL